MSICTFLAGDSTYRLMICPFGFGFRLTELSDDGAIRVLGTYGRRSVAVQALMDRRDSLVTSAEDVAICRRAELAN